MDDVGVTRFDRTSRFLSANGLSREWIAKRFLACFHRRWLGLENRANRDERLATRLAACSKRVHYPREKARSIIVLVRLDQTEKHNARATCIPV